MDIPERISLKVDLSVLASNIKAVRSQVAPLQLMAVVKADAYGVGVQPVARIARDAGAAMFGVATLKEGLEIADLKLPIQLLSMILPEEIPLAVQHGFGIPITGLAMAQSLSAEALRQQRPVYGQLVIDTGMGRAGILDDQALSEINAIVKLPNLVINGIYTHFSCAGSRNDEYTLSQLEKFIAIRSQLALPRTPLYVHCAASDAIANYSKSCRQPFTMVRCGLMMYGMAPFGELPLRPVLTLETRLAAIRVLPAGRSVGYLRQYTTGKPTRVGLIPIGYADGLPLGISNRGRVLVNDRYCPVIGRISMDYTTIDLSGVPEAAIGDRVVIFGRDQQRDIALSELAHWGGNHDYQALCALGKRVQRIYC